MTVNDSVVIVVNELEYMYIRSHLSLKQRERDFDIEFYCYQLVKVYTTLVDMTENQDSDVCANVGNDAAVNDNVMDEFDEHQNLFTLTRTTFYCCYKFILEKYPIELKEYIFNLIDPIEPK